LGTGQSPVFKKKMFQRGGDAKVKNHVGYCSGGERGKTFYLSKKEIVPRSIKGRSPHKVNRKPQGKKARSGKSGHISN